MHNFQLSNLNSQLSTLYFLGIGGIGMSAIARYFKAKGFEVAGYDRTSTVLTRELEAEGIAVNYVDEVEAIPSEFSILNFSGLHSCNTC